MIKTEEKQLGFDYARTPVMTDTKFMTGKEKEQVLKHWETFLKNGCRREDFTKALYNHLHLHCSFIAHYDINGFYDTYFFEGEDTARFLSQFDRSKGCRSIEIGMTYWLTGEEYSDINNAMCDIASRYIPQLVIASEAKQKEMDVTRAKVLLAKHGIQMKE